MKVAVLNDIHGNLPALDAVLHEVARLAVDHIVVGGDVLPGPMPRETMARLLALEMPMSFVYGNGEIAVLEQLAGKVPALVPELYRPMIRWNAEQLDAEQRRRLATWPMTERLAIPPLGDVLFCHATPRNENEIFTSATDEARLRPIFDAMGAALVVCGHTHMQFDRVIGATRIINAGSVGMPFGRTGADWLLLGPDVQLRHTDYDLEAAAARFREKAGPRTEEFIVPAVLRPPSVDEILKAYSAAELSE